MQVYATTLDVHNSILQYCIVIFKQSSMIVNEVEVPVHLIDDAACTPSKNWIMKGFTNQRMVVENAFGRLKGRWQCLLKRNTALMSDVVAACCVLHNICEMREEMFLADWNITDALQEPAKDVFQGVGGRNSGGYDDSPLTCLHCNMHIHLY